MLVMGRKNGERIICCTPAGEQIVITLLDAEDGKARIGVSASPEISIDRPEVLHRKIASGSHALGIPNLPPLLQNGISKNCNDIGSPHHPAYDLLG